MAGHAFSAVLRNVLLHKNLVVIAVALDATGCSDDGDIAGMASIAGNGVSGVIHSMQV
jgi:hypothetical protein